MYCRPTGLSLTINSGGLTNIVIFDKQVHKHTIIVIGILIIHIRGIKKRFLQKKLAAVRKENIPYTHTLLYRLIEYVLDAYVQYSRVT